VGFLSKLLLGSGTLKPELRAALESEGLVRIEEGLTAFSSPRPGMLDVALKDDGRIAIRVDYDRGDVPKVSGEITIVARTPNAAAIVDELSARGVARRAPDDPA
jgi:hypothetical protein